MQLLQKYVCPENIENPKLIRYDDFDLHLVGCNH